MLNSVDVATPKRSDRDGDCVIRDGTTFLDEYTSETLYVLELTF